MAEIKPVLPRVTAPELMPEPSEDNPSQEPQQEKGSKSGGILSTVKDNKLMLIIIALVIIILVILAYVVYKKPDKKNLPGANTGKPPPPPQNQQAPMQPSPRSPPASQEEPQPGLSQHENLVRSINERKRREAQPRVNPNDRFKEFISEDPPEENQENAPANEGEEIKDYEEE